LRIFPLYYLAILFAAAVWLFSGISPGQIFPLLYYALYLGDIPFLLSAFRQLPSNIPLGHFWSLAVEEQFYIFWPFVLAMFVGRRRSAKTLIVILWLLSLGFRLAMLGLHAQAEWQWQFLFGRTGELLAGAYLALLVRGGEDEQARLFRWLPAVFSVSAILIVIVAVLAGQPGFEAPLMSTLGLSICSLLFGSMIGLSLQHGVSQRFFSLPALRWLGKISYGVYVYHLLLRSSFAWITDHICQILGAGTGYNTRLIVLFFVATLGTLSVASLSFYTYESAFLRWKDRFAR
jgi:peptidoglycan/LPS O-acetylase OafA/YrhL